MSSKSGFTLIEVLIIIAILSILMALSYPTTLKILNKANDTNIVNNIGEIRSFMSMYYQEYNRYPKDTNNYEKLVNDVLIEYGKIADLSDYIDSHNYSVNNAKKSYELKLVSSQTNKIYIINPDGFSITQ